MTTSKEASQAYDEATALLKEWKIDPFSVLADEIGESGYLVFRRDMLGKLIFDADDRPLIDVKEWPKGFPSKRFIELSNRALGHP